MKKVILLSAVLVGSFLNAVPVQANSMALRICEYVQANDKSRLRSYLKQNRVKLRTIYTDMKCNSDNLLIFAAKSNALEVGEFIIGKLPAKKVKPEIENLAKYSAHLAEEAKER